MDSLPGPGTSICCRSGPRKGRKTKKKKKKEVEGHEGHVQDEVMRKQKLGVSRGYKEKKTCTGREGEGERERERDRLNTKAF